MLCCVVLCCVVLCCVVLCCLFCFVLFCFVLFCFVLFCFVLFCFVLYLHLHFRLLSSNLSMRPLPTAPPLSQRFPFFSLSSLFSFFLSSFSLSVLTFLFNLKGENGLPIHARTMDWEMDFLRFFSFFSSFLSFFYFLRRLFITLNSATTTHHTTPHHTTPTTDPSQSIMNSIEEAN